MSNHHDPVPIKALFTNFVVLTVLMVTTIWASQIHFGLGLPHSWGNNIIAMAIACIKAYLVVMIFMNVRNGTKLIKLYAACGFVWVTLLAFMLCDYGTRSLEPVVGWTEASALPRGQFKPPPTAVSDEDSNSEPEH